MQHQTAHWMRLDHAPQARAATGLFEAAQASFSRSVDGCKTQDAATVPAWSFSDDAGRCYDQDSANVCAGPSSQYASGTAALESVADSSWPSVLSHQPNTARGPSFCGPGCFACKVEARTPLLRLQREEEVSKRAQLEAVHSLSYALSSSLPSSSKAQRALVQEVEQRFTSVVLRGASGDDGIMQCIEFFVMSGYRVVFVSDDRLLRLRVQQLPTDNWHEVGCGRTIADECASQKLSYITLVQHNEEAFMRSTLGSKVQLPS
eukprot:365750-Chlamydomonas_euryale.AAC.7